MFILADSQCDQRLIASARWKSWKVWKPISGKSLQTFSSKLDIEKVEGRNHVFCISHLVFCISSFLSISALAGPALASWISGDYGNPLPPDWNWAKMCRTFPFHPFAFFVRWIVFFLKKNWFWLRISILQTLSIERQVFWLQ